MRTLVLFALLLPALSWGQLPALKPLPHTTQKKKKLVRRKRPVQQDTHWEYRLNMNPSVEYIGGDPTQSTRVGSGAAFHYLYGDWRFFSEGFVEEDYADAADERRSESTTALQEIYLEYKWNSFLFKAGRQSLRWSEAWTLPSLDGWTARRFNRLFFDDLSKQLIHPTGVLTNWSDSDNAIEFFYNFLPAVSLFPKSLPKQKEQWEGEWGARASHRFDSGLDADVTFFSKVDRDLYGVALNYATEYLVPKLELGQDSEDTEFAIVGVDVFYEKFTFVPRASFYRTRPMINPLNQAADSATNYHLTIRWDNSATWSEVQGFQDSLESARFYAFRLGHRLGKGFEISGMVQSYAGDPNTLFGLYEDMTGGTVFGAKLALSL